MTAQSNGGSCVDWPIENEEVEEQPSSLLTTLRGLRSDEGKESSEDWMSVDLPWEVWDSSPQLGGAALVVVDTNILLHYLPLLRATVDLLREVQTPPDRPPPCFSIAQIVFRELDGLKNSTKVTEPQALLPSILHSGNSPMQSRQPPTLGQLSRAATNWLLQVLPSPSQIAHVGAVVRGQRQHESLIPLENGRRAAHNGDDLVLDVCQYFRKNLAPSARVGLLSDDRGLCVRARVEEIDAISLTKSMTPWNLIERVDPTFAELFQPSDPSAKRSTPKPLAPRPKFHPAAPPSTPRREHSAGAPPLDTPRATPTPIPLSKEPESMELEYNGPFIPLQQTEAPTLRQVRSPVDCFRNLCDIVTHFLALPIYVHVITKLKEGSAPPGARWLEELGDWRLWTAEEAVQHIRMFWKEAGIDAACLKCLLSADGAPPPPPIPQPASTSPAPPPLTSARSTASSRWSTSLPASTPARHTPATPSLALSSPAPSRPRPAPEKRLSFLYNSLPNLQRNLTASAEDVMKWSVPRFEVILEGIEETMGIVLGGLYGVAVDEEVRRLTQDAANELRSVGVAIDPRLF